MNSSNSVVRSAREAWRCAANASWSAGSFRLGDRVVGGVPQQDVPEPKRLSCRRGPTDSAGRRPSAGACPRCSSRRAPLSVGTQRSRPPTDRTPRPRRPRPRRPVVRPPRAGRGARRAGPRSPAGPAPLERSTVATHSPSFCTRTASSTSIDEHLLDEQRVARWRRARMRSRISGRRAPDGRAGSRSARPPRVRRAVRGGRWSRCACPPPHPGRSSRSSGRAMQTSRIGTSRDQAATCSITSSSVGSPQWMSSKTATSGRRPPERLQEPTDRPRGFDRPRAVQAEQPGEMRGHGLAVRRALEQLAELGPRPLGRVVLGDAGGLDRHLRDRPERDALAVGQAASREHRAPGRRSTRRTPGPGATSRSPPDPDTVNRWHARLRGRLPRTHRAASAAGRSRPTMGESRRRS